jgi:hypothetical protein
MSNDEINMQHQYIELFLNSVPGGSFGMGCSGMEVITEMEWIVSRIWIY